MRLTSVISYSPRAEGLSPLANSTTRECKVETGHRPVRLGNSGLLFDRYGAAGRIEFNHPVALWIWHVIGEDGRALFALRRPAKLVAQARAVENVVAKNEHRRPAGDEFLADDETPARAHSARAARRIRCGCPTPSHRQGGGETSADHGGGNDQRLADPGEHDDRQRIIDHRLVVDRNQLLGDSESDRMQPGARAASQNDAFHLRIALTVSKPSSRPRRSRPDARRRRPFP